MPSRALFHFLYFDPKFSTIVLASTFDWGGATFPCGANALETTEPSVSAKPAASPLAKEALPEYLPRYWQDSFLIMTEVANRTNIRLS